MNELDEGAKRVLAAYREGTGGDAGARESAWESMKRRLEHGEALADPEVDAPRRAPAGLVVGTMLALAAAVLLWLAGRQLLSPDQSRAPDQASQQSEGGSTLRPAVNGVTETVEAGPAEPSLQSADPPESAPIESPPVAPQTETGSPRETARATEPDSDLGRHRRSRSRSRSKDIGAEPPPTTEPAVPEPRDEPSTLQLELKLLRAAQRALAAGDPEGALEHLEAHAARFPRGFLRAERMAKQAVALCRLGRRAQARKTAEALVREHPGSPLASTVATICTEEGAANP